MLVRIKPKFASREGMPELMRIRIEVETSTAYKISGIDENKQLPEVKSKWIPRSVILETLDRIPLFRRTTGIPKPIEPAKEKMGSAYCDGKKWIACHFKYSERKVAFVKSILGAYWNYFEKRWYVPDTETNRKILSSEFNLFDYDGSKIDIGETKKRDEPIYNQMPIRALADKRISTDSIVLPSASFPLFPYQLSGIKSIMSFKYRCLLADDMGLGKTIQSIVSFVTCDKWPVLIVCPASVKVNWKREIIKAYGDKFEICLVDGKGKGIDKDSDIYIVNYDVIGSYVSFFRELGIQFLVLDECHKIKNASGRTKACMEIGRGVERIIGISGTPILNRPIELYNILKLILPGMIRNRDRFGERYSNRIVTRYGIRYEGSRNSDELGKLLLDYCMVRRFKKDVLKELPSKIHSSVFCELSNMDDYLDCSEDIRTWIMKTEGVRAMGKAMRAEYLVRISKLRSLIALGKLESAFSLIDSFVESGKKLVVFGIHKILIDRLMIRYGKIAVKIDGSVNSGKRQEIVDRFQTDKNCKLFIGNINAAGVGITLTAADTVLFLEIGHTPAEHEQAEDRIYRIGQTADSVRVLYLIAENTIEQKQLEIIDKKRKVITGILDKKRKTMKESGNFNLIDHHTLFSV